MKKSTTTLLCLFISLASFSQWETIATNSTPSSGLDATTIEFQYEASTDKVMFRITTTNLASFSTGPAADFSFQLPNGLESNNPAGAHWSSITPVHKTAYIYADPGGSAPSNYTFTSWSLRIEETSTNNVLCNNCIDINVDVPANQITYTFDRNDIITDTEMGGNSATLVMVANIGHDIMNDETITESASFTITKEAVPTGIASINQNPTFAVAPNPASNFIEIPGTMEFERILIHNIAGKTVMDETASTNSSIDISTFDKGVYFLSLIKNNEVVGFSRFVKQ